MRELKDISQKETFQSKTFQQQNYIVAEITRVSKGWAQIIRKNEL
jgi:hypothetical protein